jgi:hypothetical protein
MALSDYDPIFEAAGKEWNIDPLLLKSVARQESGGNTKAVSKANAQGLMQIIPETQKYLGITDPNDPTQSIFGAAKYLSEGLDKEGTPEGALLFYHGGPGWRDAYGPESKGYVPAVTAHYQKFASAQRPAAPSAPDAPDASHSAMSDDDFLKSTGGTSGDKHSEDDAAFLTRTGGKAAEAPAPAPDAGANEYGISGDPQQFNKPLTAAETGVSNTANAVVQGAKEGFGSGPLGMSSQTDQALTNAGVFNGPNEYNPLKGINRALIGGGAALGDLALRSGGALLGAYQHGISAAGEAVGLPALGRDLAALPEAFPTGDAGGGTLTPHAPIGEAKNPLVREISQASHDALDAPLPASFRDNPGVTTPRMIGETQANPLMTAPAKAETALAAPAAAAEPRSLGAAASRDTTALNAIPAETPEQQLTNLGKSVTQSAEERAGPQMQDHDVYVPGVERPLAAREFSTQNSLDDKTLRATDPAYRAEQEKIEKENNQIMVDLLGKDAGDANALKVAHDDRSEVAPPAQQLFANEKAVDASPVVKQIDSILAGPDGKRGAVVRTLNAVKQSLLDADGSLETLPSQLYGARKNITDLLKKGVGDGADDVRASKSILTGLLDKIDPIINGGAPKYQTYLDQFHDASQPINQMEFLQKYQTGSKKLTNVDGYLQLSKVQKMLDDIYQGRKASGINAAKSLTEEQIQNITNVRNELAAQSLKDRLAKVKGSDTTQQTNRAGILGDGPLGTAVKGAAEMGAHALLFHSTGGIGNAAMAIHRAVIKPAREAAKVAKQENALTARKSELLKTKPTNPLSIH